MSDCDMYRFNETINFSLNNINYINKLLGDQPIVSALQGPSVYNFNHRKISA